MQAQAHDARIVLTVLTFVFAVTVAIPLTASSADEPDASAMCGSLNYLTYLECDDAIADSSGESGTASVVRPAIVRDTVTDYAHMEQNTWGVDFDPSRLTMSSYFSSPEDASLMQNGIP